MLLNNLTILLNDISEEIGRLPLQLDQRLQLQSRCQEVIDLLQADNIEEADQQLSDFVNQIVVIQKNNEKNVFLYYHLGKIGNKISNLFEWDLTSLLFPRNEFRVELEQAIGKSIQLITAASPPAGRPPNITGELQEVTKDTVVLKLQDEEDHTENRSERLGVYHIEQVIGFVLLREGEDSGCEGGGKKEENPLIPELKKVQGEEIELFTVTTAIEGSGSIKGILTDVANGFIKIESEDADGTGRKMGVYQIDHIVGFVTAKSGGGSGEEPGKVTLDVQIIWPKGVNHPDEVNVTLIQEEVETVVRTIDGVATFLVEPSGQGVIKGEDVPGFITPIKEIRLIGKNKFVFETLEYEAADLPVEGVSLSSSEIQLIVGSTHQLVATIYPPNASNQTVFWSSSNPAVAVVDDTGLVEGISDGEAVVTVTTEDGGKTDQVAVLVTGIAQIVQPDSISAMSNQVVILPEVVTVQLTTGELEQLPVIWEYLGEIVGPIFEIPLEDPLDTYTLTGIVEGTDLTTTLTIMVEDSVAVRVSDVSLEPNLASLFVGETLQFIATVTPTDATTPDLIWASNQPEVASVTDGLVTAISPGFAIITVQTVDGGYIAYAQISVSAVPEIELIYPTQTVYDLPEEVTINVENLVEYLPITSSTKYYVKVEQSGVDRLLGEGTVIITPETIEFNLYQVTEFEMTDNYSNEYFVYMSTDPTFPQSEDLTLMTTFKIGAPVPTIPPEDIHVNLEIIGGDLDGQPEGIVFILARELDLEPIDTTWEDYAIDPSLPDEELEFSDEVKLIGKTDQNGQVIWEEPKETIKIGGYLLLEVTPEGYVDNLNLINPESEDQALVKEVQLVRDGRIERYIINTPIS